MRCIEKIETDSYLTHKAEKLKNTKENFLNAPCFNEAEKHHEQFQISREKIQEKNTAVRIFLGGLGSSLLLRRTQRKKSGGLLSTSSF